jgi:MOSC domain-containing protein YiiM
MEGDRQRNRRFHGGPERALCVYSLERIEALQREGHSIVPGSVGDNVTIAGLEWERVVPGARLRLGEVEAEVASYTVPCKTIAGSFCDGGFTRIGQRWHPGWSRVYLRILREGEIAVGDHVELIAPNT